MTHSPFSAEHQEYMDVTHVVLLPPNLTYLRGSNFCTIGIVFPRTDIDILLNETSN